MYKFNKKKYLLVSGIFLLFFGIILSVSKEKCADLIINSATNYLLKYKIILNPNDYTIYGYSLNIKKASLLFLDYDQTIDFTNITLSPSFFPPFNITISGNIYNGNFSIIVKPSSKSFEFSDFNLQNSNLSYYSYLSSTFGISNGIINATVNGIVDNDNSSLVGMVDIKNISKSFSSNITVPYSMINFISKSFQIPSSMISSVNLSSFSNFNISSRFELNNRILKIIELQSDSPIGKLKVNGNITFPIQKNSVFLDGNISLNSLGQKEIGPYLSMISGGKLNNSDTQSNFKINNNKIIFIKK